jgi:hypothetical protein
VHGVPAQAPAGTAAGGDADGGGAGLSQGPGVDGAKGGGGEGGDGGGGGVAPPARGAPGCCGTDPLLAATLVGACVGHMDKGVAGNEAPCRAHRNARRSSRCACARAAARTRAPVDARSACSGAARVA